MADSFTTSRRGFLVSGGLVAGGLGVGGAVMSGASSVGFGAEETLPTDLERLRANRGVEVVYIVLLNALHKDAVIHAAQAGKHVLCEKTSNNWPRIQHDGTEATAGCDSSKTVGASGAGTLVSPH